MHRIAFIFIGFLFLTACSETPDCFELKKVDIELYKDGNNVLLPGVFAIDPRLIYYEYRVGAEVFGGTAIDNEGTIEVWFDPTSDINLMIRTVDTFAIETRSNPVSSNDCDRFSIVDMTVEGESVCQTGNCRIIRIEL